MKIKKLIITFGICATSISSLAQIDITDRTQTDPLLKIRTNTEIFVSENDELFKKLDPTRAEIQKDRTPQSYKRLWGKKDVLLIHPVSGTTHGFIDFSEITTHNTGNLKIYIKNDLRGNHDIKILVDNKIAESESIDRDKWEFFKIKFDHQSVELQIHATGWQWEHSFIAYRITK